MSLNLPTGWLQSHPDRIAQLTAHRQAADDIALLRITLLPVDAALLVSAAEVSRRFQLLTNDAITIALMQAYGLDDLASNDADFASIPGIKLWAPR